MEFSAKYDRSAFVAFTRSFLPQEFVPKTENIKDAIETNYSLKKSKNVLFLGSVDNWDLGVFEIEHESEQDPRVTLSRESFRIISLYGYSYGLCVFRSTTSNNWRLSLVTIEPKGIRKGRVIKEYSNPMRLSFFLGEQAKIATPSKLLSKSVSGIDDLISRFSVEVLNKEFYHSIARKFTELVGGDRKIGTEEIHEAGCLKLPSDVGHKLEQEFAVRLISRLVFCWFLKKKGLVPDEILGNHAVSKGYYHSVLEPLFFQVLNCPQNLRQDEYQKGPWKSIPFLNSGLFEVKKLDFYKNDSVSELPKNGKTLVVPNAWLKEFIEILELYNFTVDENTSIDIDLSIDPEMLGRIFENLLAEINPETGETARKETGSFYTPRMIVDYMVSESIKSYLRGETDLLDIQLNQLLDYDKESVDLSSTQKFAVINALHGMKILDPACGSGAFPMGILQQVLLILTKVDPKSEEWLEKRLEGIDEPLLREQIRKNLECKNVDYIHKLGIIRESIYGVDIQPVAVEIARLRVFLSLIVEEDVHDHESNLGIDPLPNLEFKFVVADSVRRLPALKEGDNMTLGEDKYYLPRMKNLIKRYFSCNDLDQKQKLKNDFADMQIRVFNKRLDLFSKDTQTAAISAWQPFSEKAAAWFDPFWMFGLEDGFDIVIANPPYIQLQKIKPISSILEKEGYLSYAATGDIYSIFYERGMELLNDSGTLTYISSNKWMRTNYGKKLRRLFMDKASIRILIDFGDQQLFSSATTYTNIMVLQNKTETNNPMVCDLSRSLDMKISMEDNLIQNADYCAEFSQERFLIVKEAQFKLKKKIESKGVPLKDWDISIYRGVLAGLNEAFIIDTATRDRLCKEDPRCAEIIKPIFRGKDIKRYHAEWAGLWLIATFPACNIDINHYPAIKRYLKTFGKKLHQIGQVVGFDESGKPIKSRKKTGNKWFETQDQIAYWEEFEKEKVVWSEIVSNSAFYFDSDGYFPEATTFFMTGTPTNYLPALLNSTLLTAVFKHYYAGGDLRGNTFRYKKKFLEDLPVMKLSTSKQGVLKEIVEQIQVCKAAGKNSSNLEAEIDRLVNELYELTVDEIALVEELADWKSENGVKKDSD